MQRIRTIKQNRLHHGYERKAGIVTSAHHSYVYRLALHLENVENNQFVGMLMNTNENKYASIPRNCFSIAIARKSNLPANSIFPLLPTTIANFFQRLIFLPPRKGLETTF